MVVKPPSSPQRLHRGKDSNNISTHFVFNDDDCYKQGAREGGREGGPLAYLRQGCGINYP